MKSSEILLEAIKIRDNLKLKNDFADNKIDGKLLPVLPFRISDKIKLIILGQDPTIKNIGGRNKIEYTLNLDKNGALKNYIYRICENLEIDFENIYATNIVKYFYTQPPANTMHVLENHFVPNIILLVKELQRYEKIPIITLGEPVLRLLTHKKNMVKNYWGYYNPEKLSYCEAKDNKLNRNFFPFPHQPSIRKEFYKNNFDKYLDFVKGNIVKTKNLAGSG